MGWVVFYYKGRVKFRKYSNFIHACFLCCQQTCNLGSKKLPDEKNRFPLAQPMVRACSLVQSRTQKPKTELHQDLTQNQKIKGEKMQVHLLIHSRFKSLGTCSILTPSNVVLPNELRNRASNQRGQQNWSSVIPSSHPTLGQHSLSYRHPPQS